ncbi:CPBP family intramembrane glutamic endopeptidase [Bifidobacterium samirii]|uniref:Metal-dependent membrane protease n=1 Tax=Bifidobacterium samirii TaxID=2306974 RepID=A0A430FW33_9BIFI|nr:CPBP family intramembrane glutamic endopeptidase [Bifidobacterium samirii]RSX58363.1 metal-dependent membrane protease [Bifidobacterium samirii]
MAIEHEHHREHHGAVATADTGLQRLRSAVIDELRIDRTGLKQADRPLRAAAVIVPLIILLFAAGLGHAVVASIEQLLSYTPDDTLQYTTVDINTQTEYLVGYLLRYNIPGLLGCVAMMLLRRHPKPACPLRIPAWTTEVKTFFVAFAAMMAGTTMMTWAATVLHVQMVNQATVPIGDTATMLVLLGSATAGLMEEPIALGVVAVGLRRCRVPWPAVAAIAALMRVSYHLYYGWAALAIAIWPVLFVMIYRRTGAIMPLIVAHGVYDVILTGQQLHPYTLFAEPLLDALAVIGVAIAVVTVLRKAFTPVTA